MRDVVYMNRQRLWQEMKQPRCLAEQGKHGCVSFLAVRGNTDGPLPR